VPALEPKQAPRARRLPHGCRRVDAGHEWPPLIEEGKTNAVTGARCRGSNAREAARDDDEAGAPTLARLPLGRRAHGDRSGHVGLSVEHGQPGGGDADRSRIGDDAGRSGGDLEDGCPARVEDGHEIGHALEGEPGQPRRRSLGDGCPVAPGDAFDESRIARKEPRLSPEHLLRLQKEGSQGILRTRRGGFPCEAELPKSDRGSANAEGGEHERSESDSEKQSPCRGTHEGTRPVRPGLNQHMQNARQGQYSSIVPRPFWLQFWGNGWQTVLAVSQT